MFEVYKKVTTIKALQNTGSNPEEFKKLINPRIYVTVSDKVVTIDISGLYNLQFKILVGDWLIINMAGVMQTVMSDKEFKKVYKRKD